jgi:hypothetical protein
VLILILALPLARTLFSALPLVSMRLDREEVPRLEVPRLEVPRLAERMPMPS